MNNVVVYIIDQILEIPRLIATPRTVTNCHVFNGQYSPQNAVTSNRVLIPG